MKYKIHFFKLHTDFQTQKTPVIKLITKFSLIVILFFNANTTKAQATASTVNKATFGDWGIETQLISTEILPGNDFYKYVNEGWLKSKTIPAGSSGFSNYSEAKNRIDERDSRYYSSGCSRN
ncbi:hypothetical protein [Flavobacterium sp.]|uniref:hypothetical protein n=1 Tax=Flavobacterium sp. TaxID=239 RepID=UPI003D10DA30